MKAWSYGSVPLSFLMRIGQDAHNNERREGHTIGKTPARRCVVNSVTDNEILKDLLLACVDANKQFWNFDIDGMEDGQLIEYNVGDKYDWHIDSLFQEGSDVERKLTVIIQMSESEEYEGGDLELMLEKVPDKETLRRKGTILIFPSFIHHRVTPITKGTRKSFVGWIRGPQFK